MHDEVDQVHSSLIKTPKQLLVAVIAGLGVPILLIVLIVQLVLSSSVDTQNNPNFSAEAVASRLKPVGEINLVDANAPKVEKTGQQVVGAVCASCHAAGLLNAPKIGDTASWAPRIKQGLDVLTRNAIKGVRQMPARGGNPDLSDTEIARAIVYMTNQSGAHFAEPAAAKSTPANSTTANSAPAATSTAANSNATAATPAGPTTSTNPSASTATSATSQSASTTATAAKPTAQPQKTSGAVGKTTYEAVCIACHGAGVAGAPKAGDKTAWAPRIKTGTAALYNSALHGKGAMPSKGGNPALSDSDVKAAVDYLISLAK